MSESNPAVSQDVVIITGPSGAGRSTAINALEDFGYEAIDNMPIGLLPRLLVAPTGDEPGRPIAIGVDARTRDFSATGLMAAIESLQQKDGLSITLAYIDARTETLIRRFSETRRRHPLGETLVAAIEHEQEMLRGLRDRADVLVDTSEMSPHDLRAELAQVFGREAAAQLAVAVHSFSYKRGLPRGVDMVIDCRFLRNPHWEPALRPMTGRDAAVAGHIRNDAAFQPFFDQLVRLTLMLLPAYKAEGKSYFSIGLGCTGGRHRSVMVADALANRLAQEDWQVSIRHRELEREAGDALARAVGLS